jgi:hypothetical protein
LNEQIGHVEWAENPLKSRIILTDYGRLLLRYRLSTDAIHTACVLIGMDKTEGPPTRGGRWVDQFDYLHLHEPTAVEADIERVVTSMYEPYLTDMHCGDCTCVPCTCMKCHVESLLDCFTTVGLDKYAGHSVEMAFRDGRDTLAAAITWLRETPITATWEGWEAHLERWTKERQRAIAWMEQYGSQHGFATS